MALDPVRSVRDHCAAGGLGGPSATRSVARVAGLSTQEIDCPHQCRGSADRRRDDARATAHDVTAFPALMQEIDCDPEQMLGDQGLRQRLQSATTLRSV